MADAVQNQMEKMIPELEELQQRNLFSKEEIHQIVEKRREFEYLMKRIPLQPVDALRYIEYEIKLDALRKKRKQRLGFKKALMTDHAGTRRIHSIFNRLLYKRTGQIDLWLQYIEFCKAEQSSKILSKVFSRALQVHPRSEAIWIEAASYEFASNQSIESARVLMQRAIRINKHCQRLWHEYFRLELLYIQKIIARREVLQLDPLGAETSNGSQPEQHQEANPSMILIDELPEEQAAKGEQVGEKEMSEKEKTRQEILKGAIPRIIYLSAIEAIPDDLTFRLQFVTICDLFRGRVFARDVANFVIESCLQAFPKNEEVQVVFCERPVVEFVQEQELLDEDMDEQKLEQAERLCLERFDASQNALKTPKMHQAFVLWLLGRLGKSGISSQFLLGFAQQTVNDLLKKLFTTSNQQNQSAVMALASNSSLLLACFEFIERCQGSECAQKQLQHLLERNQKCAQEAPLWLRLVQLTLKLSEPNWHEDRSGRVDSPVSSKRRRVEATEQTTSTSRHHVEQILSKALTKVSESKGQFQLYKHLLVVAQCEPEAANVKLQKLFEQALASQKEFSHDWNTLRLQFLTWCFGQLTAQEMEAWIKEFFQRPMLPNDQTLEFLRKCIQLESARVQVQTKFVTQLYEKALDVFGRTHEELWVEYIRFLRAQTHFAEANQVHARALRVFPSAVALHHLQ